MKTTLVSLFALSYCSLTSAIPLLSDKLPFALETRQNTSCENTATSRSCWGDYSIDTDWYSVTPNTGVTRGSQVFDASLELYANRKQNTGSRLKTQQLHQMDINAKL